MLKHASTTDTKNLITSHLQNGANVGAVYGYAYIAGANRTHLFTFVKDFTNVEEANAWLVEQAASGTPYQICYKLATPYTIQLDPQRLTLLDGYNSLWSDTGNTSLTYIVDTQSYINNREIPYASSAGFAESAAEAAEATHATDSDTVRGIDIFPKLNSTASCIECEAIGSLTIFSDGDTQPVRQISSNIAPLQPGSGNPSPDNIRPIAGWDTATITRTGINLISHLDYKMTHGHKTTVITDDLIEITTPSSYDYGYIKVNVKAGITYTGYWEFDFYGRDEAETKATQVGYGFYPTGGKVENTRLKSNGIYKVVRTYKPEKDDEWTFNANPNYGNISSGNGVPTQCRMRLMLVEGEYTLETIPAFEPCYKETLTATLPETVYGGKYDWDTGLLTITHAKLTLTGSGFSQAASKPWQFVKQITDLENGGASVKRVVCSHFRTTTEIWAAAGMGILTNTNCIHIGYPDAATVEEFRSFLTAQAEAGTPVEIVYVLATPYTIQLDPQTLETLKGYNAVWSDTGDTSLVYIADTKMYIDNAIASAISTVLNA